VGLDGQPNTGGGGGGADFNNGGNVTAGNGGSGIVIVRYEWIAANQPPAIQSAAWADPESVTLPAGTTVTANPSTSPSGD
jgi:hypothetical protein